MVAVPISPVSMVGRCGSFAVSDYADGILPCVIIYIVFLASISPLVDQDDTRKVITAMVY